MQLCYKALTHQLQDHHSHFLKFTDSTPDGKAELFNIVKAVFDLFEDFSVATHFLIGNILVDSCASESVTKLIGRRVGGISLPSDEQTQAEKQFAIDGNANQGICTTEISELQDGDSIFALNSNDILILRPLDRSTKKKLIGMGTLKNAVPLYESNGRTPEFDSLYLDIESLRMLCRVSSTDAKYLLVGEACFACSECSTSRFRFDL
ncbi:hypothetical protein BKA64DRAFT_55397 [Cadophora sp. MPI-SDFR-AT-0126]|nr:hypothetical protein BKA64DRAFT_55397 [Leotiomycetes sp. MPI-SDFR-AT-0126]